MLNCWIKKKILKEIRYNKIVYLQYIKLFSLSIYIWYPESDSNRHAFKAGDFESPVSTISPSGHMQES